MLAFGQIAWGHFARKHSSHNWDAAPKRDNFLSGGASLDYLESGVQPDSSHRGQTVQVIHQPVTLRIRRVNLALVNGLLRGPTLTHFGPGFPARFVR